MSGTSPAFEPERLVGITLDDRYELVSHLATGGMGAVFRARHVHLRKDVAVKVLRSDLSSSPDIVERFRREAEIASALEHENIVHVTDFGRSADGHLFLVMELLAGESLFDRLRREGFLPPEETVQILWQVCAGLEAAHALGVVHRDLKPENVFLARTASGREVTKILDFGICKIADPPSGMATQAGMVVGTPEYLSPEQATGGAVDARADLYTVGLIAWRMLAGHHPFKAEDARGLLMMQATKPVPPLTEPRPDLAAWPALVATVARACAKDPAQRHPSAAALRDDLAAALGPAFVVPPGATPAPPPALSPAPVRSAVRPPPLDLSRFAARGVFGTPVAATPGGASAAAPPVPSGTLEAVEGTVTGIALALARVRAGCEAVIRRVVTSARAHPRPAALVAAVLAVALAAGAVAAWNRGRTADRVRALLAADRPVEARAAADAALRRRPGDAELLLLRARALHRAGAGLVALDAYETAQHIAPLDDAALAEIATDLARDQRLADRAARLLRDAGARAVSPAVAAAEDGSGEGRLRALTLLRDLGAEERVDRTKLYGSLLADTECELRRAAARRLAEIGDPAALPRLREAAAAMTTRRGLFGIPTRERACGAIDAEEAVQRIEALRVPATRPPGARPKQ
ncbi:serine/threonine-protein kinase [Anaeromyxobacter oryzisoli]|uniref:serine/threonine-protein kinase n=1 Tax=Anaeromyxobacter oryzisoli TaxID=2925408 RepID=UPI001F57EC8D|nr:serine/threonine-protein kinase [Anaeromyxobacter sp. SG63]